MSDKQTDAEDKGQRGKELRLDLSDLGPEQALRGFMEVDPEKVKKRMKDQSPDEEDSTG